MDVESLRQQLLEVEELLKQDATNAGYLTLRKTLQDAIDLAEANNSESDNEDEEDEDDDEEEENIDQKIESAPRPTADPSESFESPNESKEQESKASTSAVKRKAEATLSEVISSLPTSSSSSISSAKREKRTSENDLDELPINSRIEAYDNASDTWQGAILTSYEDSQGTVGVRVLHSGEEKRLRGVLVRKIKPLHKFDKTKVRIGLKGKAKFSGDGKWYPIEVMQVTPNGCVVQYEKYRNQEEVAFEHLDVDTTQVGEVGAVAHVPKHLQVKETDSEAVKRKKKKTLHKLKRETKNAQKELILEEKKLGWQSFQASKKKNKSKRKP